MNNIKIFKNDLFEIGVKLDNGEWVFDTERVALSLGITTVAKSGNVCVRWSRVNKYLGSFRPQLGEIKKGDFIPEPAVYKLAFRANNEVAEKFQDWLAIEVLPQLRKTGHYEMPNMSKELKAILMLDTKQQAFDSRLSKVENNMTIDHAQQERLREKGQAKVLKFLGGKDTPAYQKLNKKAYSQFWNDYKRYMQVPSYRDTAVKEMDKGFKFIDGWKPTELLDLAIKGANSQIRI